MFKLIHKCNYAGENAGILTIWMRILQLIEIFYQIISERYGNWDTLSLESPTFLVRGE